MENERGAGVWMSQSLSISGVNGEGGEFQEGRSAELAIRVSGVLVLSP